MNRSTALILCCACLVSLVLAGADSAGAATIDFSGTEGGVDASTLGAGIAAPLAAAVAKVSDLVKFENISEVVVNKEATQRGYDEAIIQSVN